MTNITVHCSGNERKFQGLQKIKGFTCEQGSFFCYYQIYQLSVISQLMVVERNNGAKNFKDLNLSLQFHNFFCPIFKCVIRTKWFAYLKKSKFQCTYRSSYLMLAHCARLPPLSKSIGYAQSDTKRTKRRTTGNLLVNLLLSQRGKEFLSLENQEQKKTFKTCPCRFGSRFRSLVCQQGKKDPSFYCHFVVLFIN